MSYFVDYVTTEIAARLPRDLDIQALRISYRTTDGFTVSPYSEAMELTLIPLPEPSGGLIAGALLLALLVRRKR